MTTGGRQYETIRRHPRSTAFTLLEMVVSLTVVAVIMVGIGSTMLIAGKAMPQADSLAYASIAGSEVLQLMASELQYAVAVDQRSARMIEFTVADRSGDGNAEVIRYEWSGTAGAPITRTYNSETPVPMLADVGDFDLQYELETVSTEVPQGNESAETLLAHYSSSWDLRSYLIKENETYAQYFHPALPADAISWKITRACFYARRAGWSSGEARVQIQSATAGGLPTGVILDQRTLDESRLPLWYVWCEMPYTKVFGLSPQQGICLAFKWLTGSEACDIQGRGEDVTAPNILLSKSTDGGKSWNPRSGQSLLFWIYGTVTTAGTPQVQYTYYLNRVGVRLRVGSDPQATVQTHVRAINRPEVMQ